jgi:ABC-type transport system involved in multi-copper enzyme maturation permease subunit
VFGPVFRLDSVRAGQRTWLRIVRWGYVAILFLYGVVPVLQLAWLAEPPRGTAETLIEQQVRALNLTWSRQSLVAEMIETAELTLQTVVVGQLLVLVLAAPAFTAGALIEEKARGTLPLLLTTGLTPWDIVADKLLGRTLPLLLLLAGLPVLCLLAGVTGKDLPGLLALCALPVPLILAAGAVGLLAALWAQTTAQALLRAYLAGAAVLLLIEWPGSPLGFLGPLSVLRAVWENSGRQTSWLPLWRLFWLLLFWGGIALAALVVTAWRLRPASLAELDAPAGKESRWSWLRSGRPPPGDDPLCWKERYVEGVSPSLRWRRLPRWLMLGIVSGLWALLLLILGGYSIGWRWGSVFNPAEAARLKPALEGVLSVQGAVITLLAGLLAGVRAAGAVSGERQRQTWEFLLLTDLEPKELVGGKFRGILWALFPYLLASLLPAVLFSFLAGWETLFWPLLWGATAMLVARVLAAVGLCYSAGERSAWGRLGLTFMVGFGVLLAVLPVPAVGWCAGVAASRHPEGVVWWYFQAMFGFSLLVAWVIFCPVARSFLKDAEKGIRPPGSQLLLNEGWHRGTRRYPGRRA